MKRLYPLIFIFLLVCLLWARNTEPTSDQLKRDCEIACGEWDFITKKCEDNVVSVMNEEQQKCYCYSECEYREYKRKE